MQREILFKAKRIDNGQWCYFGLFEKYPENVINPDTICQYTGINDKNGNKIFEFDRIRVYIGAKTWYDTHIIFRHGAFWLDENKTVAHGITPLSPMIEIIGNIHDKPQQP